MSQENNTPEKSKKSRTVILLGVLGLVLIVAVYLQFFTGGNAVEKATAGVIKSSTTTKPSPTPQRTNRTADEIVSQPLDLASLSNRASAAGGTGRNIFIYPTPTPVPP